MQHLAEFFEQGGFFMYVNLICSTITLAFIVERTIFFLGKGSVNAKAFLEQIRKLVAANNVDRAIKLCSATEAPVARVAKAGLTRLPKGEAAVTTAIEETLVDVTPELKKRIGSLWSLANIATLIGLLGTITGLIGAFAAVAKAAAADRSTILSAKISGGHEQHLARPRHRRDLHDRSRVPQRRVEEAAARARGVRHEAREPARRVDATRGTGARLRTPL